MSVSDVVCKCGAVPERDSMGNALPCMRCFFGGSAGPAARIAQLEAQLADAWKALGTTAEDAADDPETASLADSIRVSLRYERDRAADALDAHTVEWQEATGLLAGGDPGGVTPETLRKFVGLMDEIARAADRLVENMEPGKNFLDAARALDELKTALKPWREMPEG